MIDITSDNEENNIKNFKNSLFLLQDNIKKYKFDVKNNNLFRDNSS